MLSAGHECFAASARGADEHPREVQQYPPVSTGSWVTMAIGRSGWGWPQFMRCVAALHGIRSGLYAKIAANSVGALCVLLFAAEYGFEPRRRGK